MWHTARQPKHDSDPKKKNSPIIPQESGGSVSMGQVLNAAAPCTSGLAWNGWDGRTGAPRRKETSGWRVGSEIVAGVLRLDVHIRAVR